MIQTVTACRLEEASEEAGLGSQQSCRALAGPGSLWFDSTPSRHHLDKAARRVHTDPAMRLSSLHTAYLAHLRALGCSSHTLTAYMYDFRIFANWLGRDDVRALAPGIASAYLGHLSERGNASGGIRRRIASVSAFCTWLRRRGDIQASPFDGAERPKRRKGLPRAVPDAHVEAMLALADQRDQALVGVMRWAGLRVGDVENLSVEDVDTERGIFVIRAGKGGKDRVVPIFPQLRPLLAPWLAQRPQIGPVFPGGHEAPRLGRRPQEKAVRRLCERAGIPPCTPHQLRHSFGTWAVRAGIPINQVSAMMGHEDLATTAIYCRIAGSDYSDALARAQAWADSARPAPQTVEVT